MQYLKISKTTKLSDLIQVVGERNVDSVLNVNRLKRSTKVGANFDKLCKDVVKNTKPVNWQRKSTILDKLTRDSDVFEEASLLSEDGWKVLSTLDTFPERLKIPETMRIPDSIQVIGNNRRLKNTTYKKVIRQLEKPPHQIDSTLFGSYNSRPASRPPTYSTTRSPGLFKDFNVPWGDVVLYDSLSGDSISIPGYPEEMEDDRVANYEAMPDILYQYEPWQVYTASGPRTASYAWELHRQMWTGDEKDGKANELIRFCQGCLYPDYKGSAVFTSRVSLYICGSPVISGILNNVNVKWNGPIGTDGYYLAFSLTLGFIEISNQPLNHNVVRTLPLIS